MLDWSEDRFQPGFYESGMLRFEPDDSARTSVPRRPAYRSAALRLAGHCGWSAQLPRWIRKMNSSQDLRNRDHQKQQSNPMERSNY